MKPTNLNAALDEWFEKSEWARPLVRTGELGMHRLDVIKKRFYEMHEAMQEFVNYCGRGTVWNLTEANDKFKAILANTYAPSPAAEGAKVAAGWIRAIDEALVVHYVDVADAADSYETAKDKLNRLLCCAQDIGALHAQPAEMLSDARTREIISEQTGFEWTPGEMQAYNASDLMRIARAIERAVLAQQKGCAT